MKIDLDVMPERENRKAIDSKIRKPASQDVGMSKTGGHKPIEQAALPALRLESHLRQ